MGIIENYNNIVDTMNNLIDKGYKVSNFASKSMGWGFYLDLNEKHYIECFVDYDKYYIKFQERTTKFWHDVVNDIVIETTYTTDYNKVESIVLDMIERNKPNKKKDFLKLLNEFKKAYNNIVEFCANEEEDIFNKYACDNYPFEKSFDEIPINDWVNSLEEKIQEDK